MKIFFRKFCKSNSYIECQTYLKTRSLFIFLKALQSFPLRCLYVYTWKIGKGIQQHYGKPMHSTPKCRSHYIDLFLLLAFQKKENHYRPSRSAPISYMISSATSQKNELYQQNGSSSSDRSICVCGRKEEKNLLFSGFCLGPV